MPGVVTTGEGKRKFSDAFKVEKTQTQVLTSFDGSNGVKQETETQGAGQPHDRTGLLNGDHVNLNGVTASPSASTPKPTMEVVRVDAKQARPEIPRISVGFIRLSTLLSRMAQEGFNDLNKTITEMVDVHTQHSGPNGIANHANHHVNGVSDGHTENDVKQKDLLMNYTDRWRPKFIKALVLTNWAERAEEVSRVIDLKVYLDQQGEEWDRAVYEMGQLLRIILQINAPSPDINAALQILLLGKASWLPDSQYLEPDSLTPQRQLDTLRRLNALISIRLNLHETLPPAFRDFSIASGRVTFHVVDEFEVDLSIISDDPTSRFFFIDFRFAFSPGRSKISPGGLLGDLAWRADDALTREGLQGLHDILRNLVLTYKLSILRSQAYQMQRGFWSEHLVVEPVRRAVVVQYWPNKPGGKNWIEIGITRGPEKRFAYLEQAQRIPQISVRYFKAGKEVKDAQIDLRLGDLSMEFILQQVIAQHSSEIFMSAQSRLAQSLLYSSGSLKVRSRTSARESMAVSLMAQITSTAAIKIVQEPVTGRFAVEPASPMNARLESGLNRLSNPAVDVSSQIVHLRALAIQAEVDAMAGTVGWDRIRSVVPSREALRQHFPKDVQQLHFYRPLSWHADWLLVFTASVNEDLWWIAELSDTPPPAEIGSSSLAMGRSLKAVYKTPIDLLAALSFDPTPVSLARIERCAAGMICQHNDARFLHNARIPHKIPPLSNTASDFPIIFRYPNSIGPKFVLRSRRAITIPWEEGYVKLTYRGLSQDHAFALRVASTRLSKPRDGLHKLIASIPSLALHPTSGSFAFQLKNKIGDTCVDQLTKHLEAAERLITIVDEAADCRIALVGGSLTHVEFAYSGFADVHSSLKATVHFEHDEPERLSLSGGNPHLRILDFLNDILRVRGLKSLVATLRITEPLLVTFAVLEARHRSSDFVIIARSEEWYTIRYNCRPPSTLPASSSALVKSHPQSNQVIRIGFEARLRDRRGKAMWMVPEGSIRRGPSESSTARNQPGGPATSQATTSGDTTNPNNSTNTTTANESFEWQTTLRSVMRAHGPGWQGMHGGIVSESFSIAQVIENLDAVFWARKLALEQPDSNTSSHFPPLGQPSSFDAVATTSSANQVPAAAATALMIPGAPAPVAQMTAHTGGKRKDGKKQEQVVEIVD